MNIRTDKRVWLKIISSNFYFDWSAEDGSRSLPITRSISSWILCWMSLREVIKRMAQRNTVAVVSPPATNKSDMVTNNWVSIIYNHRLSVNHLNIHSRLHWNEALFDLNQSKWRTLTFHQSQHKWVDDWIDSDRLWKDLTMKLPVKVELESVFLFCSIRKQSM